jgi:hypothetical protein
VPKESALYKLLRARLAEVSLNRLETRVALGMPDCLAALPTGQWVTLELKVVASGRKIRLSPHQVAFHVRHAQMPSWIVVQYWPPGTARAPDSILLLYHGSQAQALLDTGIDTPAVLRERWRDVDWQALVVKLANNRSDWPTIGQIGQQ